MLVFSEILSWIAIGAAAAAGEGLLSPGWPMVLGFLWTFVRLVVAPVVLDAWTYVFVSLALCILAGGYSAHAAGLVDAALLRKGPALSLALLGLGYGTFAGSVAGLVGARLRPRDLSTDEIQQLHLIDRTALGTTTSRKTNPIVVGIGIAVVVYLIWFLVR